MSILVVACPRCDAQKMSFDVLYSCCIATEGDGFLSVYTYETFCICRECKKSTVFVLKSDSFHDLEKNCDGVEVIEYVSQKHFAAHTPPKHLPKDIKSAFEEAETCLAVGCFNAAGVMFRLCLDLAVLEKLETLLKEEKVEVPSDIKKRTLAAKLNWLFDESHINPKLRELSTCIKDDGNDGAHRGTLGKADAEDLLDFTQELLEHLYTAPKKLKIANERKKDRRSKKSGA